MYANCLIATILLLFTLQSCNTGNDSNNSTGELSGNFISLPDTVPDPSWSKENVVVVHCISEPDNLHPTNGTTAIRAELLMYTQMNLLRTDVRRPGILPGLCTEMPVLSDDGLTAEFELRKEPRWDDGSPVTVDDVIFTIKANKCPLVQNAFAKSYWANVKDLFPDAAQQNRFKVTMKEKSINNVAFWIDFPILQRQFHDPQKVLDSYTYERLDTDTTLNADEKLKAWAAKFNAPEYGFNPSYLNGLGMYKVEKWDAGQLIVLQKKKNHWTKGSDNSYEKALPDKIIYKVNRDANAQVLDFKAQVFDASAYISAKTLFDLRTDASFNKNYHSRFIDTYGYTYIAMNMRPGSSGRPALFTDAKVRRAMAMLTPVDDVIRVVNRNINKRITGPVSPLKEEYYAQPVIQYDLSAAVQLLNEAGWKDSDGDNILDKMMNGKKVNFEFDFNYLTTQTEWKDMALIICEAYNKAGLKAHPNPVDQSVMFGNARAHDFDMMMGSWAGNALPEDFTQVWHSASWESNGSNYPGFGNAESDSLIEMLRITSDTKLRQPMLNRFQQIVYEEQPYVFLYGLVKRNILHKRWSGGEMYSDRPGMLYNHLKIATDGVEAN